MRTRHAAADSGVLATAPATAGSASASPKVRSLIGTLASSVPASSWSQPPSMSMLSSGMADSGTESSTIADSGV